MSDDIETEYQSRWLLSKVLRPPPATILDAGCGAGQLAAALIANGYEVTALDPDPEAVAAAHATGVPALQADLIAYEGGPFDVVLFSRSLHHMPLEDRLDRACELLAPGGLVVADEFAYDRADPATATWFYETLTLLVAAGVAEAHDHGIEPVDPFERWMLKHRDQESIHGGQAMIDALRRRLSLAHLEEAAYLFGYLSASLAPGARATQVGRELLDIEQSRIARGFLRAVGLRLVAVKD